MRRAAGTAHRAGALRRGVVWLTLLGLGSPLLAAGCARSPEAEPASAPEPEPRIVLGPDSLLVYDGEPRRLREVFVLEVREPLAVRRIDGRAVERAAAFYHLLPGRYSLGVDYFAAEVERGGRGALDEDVVRWRLVTLQVTVHARAGEGARLESETRAGKVATRTRRGKTALVETSVLIY